MAGAIVIGAGPGLGAALARRFARESLPVTLVARHPESLVEISAQVVEIGARVLSLRASATDESELRAALDTSVAEFGPPDLLVYNAALLRRDVPGELSSAQLLDAYAVNVVGAMTAATHLAPAMAARGTGSILLTSGLPEPAAAFTSLSLGKAALRALADVLAQQLGPDGVHVATVTIRGSIDQGTRYDPDQIADHYWLLHQQPRDEWELDHQFTGKP
jgi:NAD(P)-dependent dehydrogenase (short-subunit alcohol dehydrogenase family)